MKKLEKIKLMADIFVILSILSLVAHHLPSVMSYTRDTYIPSPAIGLLSTLLMGIAIGMYVTLFLAKKKNKK